MDNLEEDWKPFPYNEDIIISSLGRVKNSTTGNVLKAGLYGKDYLNIKIPLKKKYKNFSSKSRSFYVHQLVMLSFIGPSNGLEIDHIDGDTNNNRLSNLRYVTSEENINHELTSKQGGEYKQYNAACNISKDSCFLKYNKYTKELVKKYNNLEEAVTDLINFGLGPGKDTSSRYRMGYEIRRSIVNKGTMYGFKWETM